MDHSLVQTTPSLAEDEWGVAGTLDIGVLEQESSPSSSGLGVVKSEVDAIVKDHNTDGFVIPSLGIGDSEQVTSDAPEVEGLKSSSFKAGKEENMNMYLGPHGAPPQVTKQHELNSSGRKQKFKQKLKEADLRNSGAGRENKLENLRDLVGGRKTVNMPRSSPNDWLDLHCHESEFERRYPKANF